MKKYLLWIVCILIIGIQSCTVEKRLYTKGYHVTSSNKIKVEDSKHSTKSEILSKEVSKEAFAQVANAPNEFVADPSNLWIKATGDCDVIYFKDGSQVDAKIIMISDTDVQYKRCHTKDEIMYSTSMENVMMIEYMNGEKYIPNRSIDLKDKEEPKTVVKTYSNNPPQANGSKSYHPLSIVSFALGTAGLAFWAISLILFYGAGILGGASFLFLGILLGIAALILGIIGLIRIKKNPDKYKGKVFAILGIAFGGTLVIAFLIMLFSSMGL